MHRLWTVSKLTLLLFFVTGCGEGRATVSVDPPRPNTPAPSQQVNTTTPVEPTATPAPPTPVLATPATAPTAPPAATEASSSSDLPALEPENAPPTPAQAKSSPGVPSEPVRIIIPAINLDLEPVAVGLDERRVPIVPKHDVGWFTASARPGERSNVIFWGHVLRWKDSPTVPAPFERIHELVVGAEMTVITADGAERHYRVVEQIQTKPEDTQLLYPTLSERLTLVSCIGDKVIQQGILTKEFRLVTVAEPIP